MPHCVLSCLCRELGVERVYTLDGNEGGKRSDSTRTSRAVEYVCAMVDYKPSCAYVVNGNTGVSAEVLLCVS